MSVLWDSRSDKMATVRFDRILPILAKNKNTVKPKYEGKKEDSGGAAPAGAMHRLPAMSLGAGRGPNASQKIQKPYKINEFHS